MATAKRAAPVPSVRDPGAARRASARATSPRAPGRPTAEQASQLRETLLHAAMKHFIERGFEGASMDGIGRDARVSKITIYRQYGDKRSLFLAVAYHALTGFRSALAAKALRELPPPAGLRELIRITLEAFRDPAFLEVQRLLIAEAVRFPEIGQAMLDEASYSLEPMVDYLSWLRAEGHIALDNPHEAALQLTAVAIGGTRPLMLDPAKERIDRARWVESVYTTFARAWGLEPVPRPRRVPDRGRKR